MAGLIGIRGLALAFTRDGTRTTVHGAGARRHEAGDHPQQRRLADPRGADDGQELARPPDPDAAMAGLIGIRGLALAFTRDGTRTTVLSDLDLDIGPGSGGLTVTVPALGGTRPAITRSSVDLPTPEAPAMAGLIGIRGLALAFTRDGTRTTVLSDLDLDIVLEQRHGEHVDDHDLGREQGRGLHHALAEPGDAEDLGRHHRDLVELAEAFGFRSAPERLVKVVWPAAVPGILVRRPGSRRGWRSRRSRTPRPRR
jgi:hypothetical protein